MRLPAGFSFLRSGRQFSGRSAELKRAGSKAGSQAFGGTPGHLRPYHVLMALTDTERRLCDLVKARSDLLLKQLAEHVAIPTGRNYTPGLNRYRDLLTGPSGSILSPVRGHHSH